MSDQNEVILTEEEIRVLKSIAEKIYSEDVEISQTRINYFGMLMEDAERGTAILKLRSSYSTVGKHIRWIIVYIIGTVLAAALAAKQLQEWLKLWLKQ